MPIYEFTCAKCGREFEEITNRDSVPCPHCGSHDTVKIMSACARRPSKESSGQGATGGCASCSGGNCASCGR